MRGATLDRDHAGAELGQRQDHDVGYGDGRIGLRSGPGPMDEIVAQYGSPLGFASMGLHLVVLLAPEA